MAIKNLFGKVDKTEKTDIEIRVMMVGGRRCGKTSILAAMQSNFQQVFASSQLSLVNGDMETLNTLQEKHDEINNYFANKQESSLAFTPDNNPTLDKSVYSFLVSMADRKGKVKMNFVDYPGEWLMDGKKNESLKEEMEESQIIIIAIDTPHMMEEKGKFNDKRNLCSLTSQMLKMALDEKEDSEKLILFVPLKCERYYNDGKMDEVCAKTEESYGELINYLKRKDNLYGVAILPILTLGKAAFSRFESNENGEILTTEPHNLPEKPIYFFTDPDATVPAPQYCEQPAVYTLAYVMWLVEQKKGMSSNVLLKLIRKMDEHFFKAASAEDYAKQKDSILCRQKKSEDGYKILQNPMKF